MGVKETKFGKQLELEAGGEAHIPYSSHVDPNTLKTQDGKLIQIIKLEGVAHETSDTFQLDAWKNARNFLWRSISDNKISIWTHIIRYKKNDYPKGDFEDGFAKNLNSKYQQSLEKTEMFVNDIYICIVRQSAGDKIASFAETIKSLLSKVDSENIRKKQTEQIKSLDDVTRKVLKGLASYSPKLLSIYSRSPKGVRVDVVKKEEDQLETDGIVRLTKEVEIDRLKNGTLAAYSAPLEFIGFLVNGFWRNIPLGFYHAGKTVLASKISFEKEYFVVQSTNRKRCGGMISIKEYVNQTAAGMTDGLLALPVEFTLTQSFTFLAKTTAVSLFKQHQARLKNSGDLAESQIDELDFALDQLSSNEFCMGNHHMTLAVIGDGVRKVADDLALCEAELSEFGLLTAREYLGMEACYWAQLPGNHSYIARKAPITSKNFASFASFHNYPSGKLRGNHWGESVALLKTVSGTPYYFNFHYPKDLGNTTVIGPSGAGKTVLMLFLSAMLEKHKPRQVFFDKDRGAEIFVRAQKGNYSPIEAGKPTGFNPLQLPETDKNKKFLRDWIAKLVEVKGQQLTAEEMEDITKAVNVNYKLEPHERRLSSIWPTFQYGEDNSIKARLKAWLKDGDKGWVFDNEEDSLNLNSRLIGFDVTDFLDDPIIRTPLLMYLFQRIDTLIDGERISITLDEGWKLLDDEYFGKMFKDWLKVIRKKNGFTVFGTQEPSDVTQSAVGKTIMSQSPTQIFLPNPKADREDYIDGFKLTEREFEIIKSLDIESRCFIIKQGQKSVVAELNLANMDDEISILSGTTANVELLDNIRREVGNNPKDWMPPFFERRT